LCLLALAACSPRTSERYTGQKCATNKAAYSLSSRGPFPRNFRTDKPYRGVNILLLWSSPYSSPFWLTYKQAMELNGSVREGEKGTPIVFYKQLPIRKEDQKAADGKKERTSFVLCYYTVFNVEQCDGAPCRREEGVVRDDPGKPKLSCVHQSHRMPKGLWDQSMTGARPNPRSHRSGGGSGQDSYG
jgi:hypothetical protein